GGELGRVEESGGVVGGAFGQVLDLVQVPPAHGGDLTGGGVDLSGDGGLEQLPDVTGAAGAAASAGVEPAHGGLGQADHGQADFLGDLGLGGGLVAGVLVPGVGGGRGGPGRGGGAGAREQLAAVGREDRDAGAGAAAGFGGRGVCSCARKWRSRVGVGRPCVFVVGGAVPPPALPSGRAGRGNTR